MADILAFEGWAVASKPAAVDEQVIEAEDTASSQGCLKYGPGPKLRDIRGTPIRWSEVCLMAN